MGSTACGHAEVGFDWVWVTEVWFDSFELGSTAFNWVGEPLTGLESLELGSGMQRFRSTALNWV
jgi:hypothetical protein